MRTFVRRSLRPGTLAIVTAAMLAVPAAVVGADITVNGLGDAPDANGGAGACETATPGVCTLRAAIQTANTSGGHDDIGFSFSGMGARVIDVPTDPLPAVTESLTIDGYSVQGASQNTRATGSNAVLRIVLAGPGGQPIDGLRLRAPATVRGLVIGRFRRGIDIQPGGEGSRVQGNFIGTDRTGLTASRNHESGVHVDCQADVAIGSADRRDRNVISGNQYGIQLCEDVESTSVRGNLIGVGANGTKALGNKKAGIVAYGSQDVIIGGSVVGARNVIAYNAQGVAITANPPVDAAGIRILGNSIYANRGLGIDLDIDGVTPNDPGDGDHGANDRQNFPVITSATTKAGKTRITGRLSSKPASTYLVQAFIEPDGEREGKTLLKSKTVTTAGNGSVDFNLKTKRVRPGLWVTATATSLSASPNETSEFSAARRVRD